MIAVKREVAAVNTAGFPWSECLGRPDWHGADPKTDDKSLYRLTVCPVAETTCENLFSRESLSSNTQDTHGSVYSHRLSYFIKSANKEATFFMANQIMRITLKAYDHKLVDASAKKIIETVRKTGSQVSGPVPLPTKKEVVTILRAVHKYKDSREQFEQRTHKRLIDIITPTQKTVDALQRLEMPAGVAIDIKMKAK